MGLIEGYNSRIDDFLQLHQSRLNSFRMVVSAIKKGRQLASVFGGEKKKYIEDSIFILKRKMREHATEVRVSRIAMAQLSAERDLMKREKWRGNTVCHSNAFYRAVNYLTRESQDSMERPKYLPTNYARVDSALVDWISSQYERIFKK